MGIVSRGLKVIGLSIDFPIVGIADGFLLVLGHINVYRLIVDEAEVKGEDALAVTIWKGISDISISVVSYAISPSVGGRMSVVIAKSDSVGLGLIHVTYLKDEMYDTVAAM